MNNITVDAAHCTSVIAWQESIYGKKPISRSEAFTQLSIIQNNDCLKSDLD